ncbi:MAG: hypothetical protein ACRERU_11520, partial [Methylococcales bacterium]
WEQQGGHPSLSQRLKKNDFAKTLRLRFAFTALTHFHLLDSLKSKTLDSVEKQTIPIRKEGLKKLRKLGFKETNDPAFGNALASLWASKDQKEVFGDTFERRFSEVVEAVLSFDSDEKVRSIHEKWLQAIEDTEAAQPIRNWFNLREEDIDTRAWLAKKRFREELREELKKIVYRAAEPLSRSCRYGDNAGCDLHGIAEEELEAADALQAIREQFEELVEVTMLPDQVKKYFRQLARGHDKSENALYVLPMTDWLRLSERMFGRKIDGALEPALEPFAKVWERLVGGKYRAGRWAERLENLLKEPEVAQKLRVLEAS